MPKTDDLDTSDVVSTLLRTLKGGGNEEKAEGLMRLAMTLDECSGAEGAQLGEAMRAAGGIELLVQHVDHEDPTVHQTVLHLIANFSAKAVDAGMKTPNACSKELVHCKVAPPHFQRRPAHARVCARRRAQHMPRPRARDAHAGGGRAATAGGPNADR